LLFTSINYRDSFSFFFFSLLFLLLKQEQQQKTVHKPCYNQKPSTKRDQKHIKILQKTSQKPVQIRSNTTLSTKMNQIGAK